MPILFPSINLFFLLKSLIPVTQQTQIHTQCQFTSIFLYLIDVNYNFIVSTNYRKSNNGGILSYLNFKKVLTSEMFQLLPDQLLYSSTKLASCVGISDEGISVKNTLIRPYPRNQAYNPINGNLNFRLYLA